MLKTAGNLAAATMLALSLCACGSSATNQPSTNTQPTDTEQSAPAETEKKDEQKAADSTKVEYTVDKAIDYSVEGGSVKFNHIEKADPQLTESDKALVFVYEFTNKQDHPGQFQSVLYIKYFQNGVELKNNLSYSPTAKDQYDLVHSFYSDVMKGGTVTFGQIVDPKDDSPITVMVKPNPSMSDDEYQMMEVTFGGSGASSDGNKEASADDDKKASAEDIDAALQGTWNMGDEAKWTFDHGSVNVEGALTMSGTYEVDADNSAIIGRLEATDGSVKVTFPFEYDGKTLRVFKNSEKAEEMAKQ